VTKAGRWWRWGVEGLLVVVLGLLVGAIYQWWVGDGGQWRDADGRSLPDGDGEDGISMSSMPGAEHCGWESVTFVEVAWPPGSVEPPDGDVRQFVGDPDGILDGLDNLSGSYEDPANAPPDVVATGVHTDDVELWIAGSDPDAIFLRNSSGTYQRWPRADPKVLCA